MKPTIPISLDGIVITEGKGNRANFEQHFPLAQYYKKYLTQDELYEFFDLADDKGFGCKFYEWETPNQRIQKSDRYIELLNKIDQQAVYELVQAQYQQTKVNKNKKHASYELGPREFTLTYSPKWNWTDDEARQYMELAILRLIKYNKDEIVELRAVGEFASQSHVHCFYELKGGLKIPDKHFTRAYKMWNTKVKIGPFGHQGGHHALVHNVANFRSYIDKEVSSAWLDISHPVVDDPKNNLLKKQN